MIRVPRVFHRVWVGGKPMPRQYEQWGQSWLDLHPGWTMKLWTEANLPQSAFPQLVQQAPSLAHRADIHRYEVLYREGGIYVDCDFQCLRSLEPIIEDLDAFSAIQHDDIPWKAVNNAFFGVAPGHPLMRDALKMIPRVSGDTYSLGPPFLTHLARVHGIKLFPRKWFYPYEHNDALDTGLRAQRQQETFPDAYAVHHWGSLWTDSWARIVKASKSSPG